MNTKPRAPTCSRRLRLALQSLKTAQKRLYLAIGHKAFSGDADVLRIYHRIESDVLDLERLAELQEQFETNSRAALLSKHKEASHA